LGNSDFVEVFAVNQEAIHGHVMALVSLLPLCDTPEKISLLTLSSPIAQHRPSHLEASLSSAGSKRGNKAGITRFGSSHQKEIGIIYRIIFN
jgi:hypothetical protein